MLKVTEESKTYIIYKHISPSGKVYIGQTNQIPVAEAFIPNPNNYPIVNHKDEDKNNFVASNLEWCDYSYNTSYSNKGIDRRNEKGKVSNFRVVLKLTLEGIEVGRYNGVREACEKNRYKRGRLDSILYNSNSRIFDNFIWVLV